MRDENLATPSLPAANSAVLYLLKRMQVDANLRHYMLHTEAFARIVAAEAERKGASQEDIEKQYSSLALHCKDDRPKVMELYEALEESLKLQSHYAMLLNDYDCGERMQFGSVEDWLARLRWCKAQR